MLNTVTQIGDGSETGVDGIASSFAMVINHVQNVGDEV